MQAAQVLLELEIIIYKLDPNTSTSEIYEVLLSTINIVSEENFFMNTSAMKVSNTLKGHFPMGST